MPVADYKTYCAMLDRARARHFALPAVDVTSLTAANAVLRGLAESKADGIIQISTGGGAFASGSSLKDSALGAISIAEHVHRAADLRSYLALAEAAIAERVKQAVRDLRGNGKTMFAS